MSFVLGKRSRAELEGVHPDLVAVVERALEKSPVDFVVYDGLRDESEQRAYVARGASHTMLSKHLDGLAVDLVPWLGGKLAWDWPALYQVAVAVRSAAQEIGVSLRWGAAWDINWTTSSGNAEDVSAGYAARRKRAGLKVFLDGPHFELIG